MQHAHVAADVAHPVILRLPDVRRLTGLGRSTIYRLLAAGQFPPPVQLAARAVGWRQSDVDSWTAARPLASRWRIDTTRVARPHPTRPVVQRERAASRPAEVLQAHGHHPHAR
jgi:prophage regulatory protein